MRDGTKHLETAAESIFQNLGYAIHSAQKGLRAKRKWRVVDVTPMTETADVPEAGEYRCFVTWADEVETLEGRVQQASPPYEWAIIGIERDESKDSDEALETDAATNRYVVSR